MKKTLTTLAIVAILAACKSKPLPVTVTVDSIMQVDSMAMNHNSFSDQPLDVTMDGLSDTLISSDGSTYVKVNPNAPAVKTLTAKQAQRPVSSTTKTSTSKAATSSGTTGSASTGSAGTGVSSTGTETATPEAAKKKGWSNTAKGTVIGAGTGAVAGAIIGKNKVKGAVIGGLIGAGGGFVVGKVLDKKAESKQ